MDYITLETFKDGSFKHRDWICHAICSTNFTNIIKYIVEEETKDFLNNQPERSKREDFHKYYICFELCDCGCPSNWHSRFETESKKEAIDWVSKDRLKRGFLENERCGALNSMET